MVNYEKKRKRNIDSHELSETEKTISMMIYPAQSGTKQHSIEFQLSITLNSTHDQCYHKEELKRWTKT